ncbi:cbb3-type cytochrome c oxidase subunit I [uncultured Algibacter sp.]|uniref:cbb3-type cytochrome c oxidase subunit I n=1 Tax=uncultured Algibacter sp. TaxID=298659 RepID=UPI00345CEA94
MNFLKNKPYIIFWIIGIIIFIPFFKHISFDSTIDINVHDTYFVVAHYHLGMIFLIFFVLIGLIYWVLNIFKRKKVNWLTICHIILTIMSTFLLFYSDYLFGSSTFQSNNKYPYFDGLLNSNLIKTLAFLMFGIGQILFFFNILIGILKTDK